MYIYMPYKTYIYIYLYIYIFGTYTLEVRGRASRGPHFFWTILWAPILDSWMEPLLLLFKCLWCMARMRERCAIQLPMQPKHQRNHLIQQAETTLEKVTKRVHKEVPYIFVVLIKTQPTSLALWTLSALLLHPRQTCRKESVLWQLRMRCKSSKETSRFMALQI